MVGGKVVETIVVGDRIWVNVEETPYSVPEQCAIYVERTPEAEKVAAGDSIWWQSRSAYWTPEAFADMPSKLLQGGVDYDIELPRLGYSGAERPDVQGSHT